MASETRIAIPIVSPRPPLERQIDAARAAGADMVELRVDLIGDIAAVEDVLRAAHVLPIILTVRPESQGGHWTANEAERLKLIERLGRLGPEFIDIELAVWKRSAEARRMAGELCGESGGSRLIVSHHDFETTPDDLGGIFDELAQTPADVIKAVFTARETTDTWRVLEQLRRLARERDVIALAMGEAGIASRVLARKLGGFLTFASLAAGGESAAGQPTIAALRERYGWNTIGRSTRVYGVVGWPVTHSRSPRVHNAAMRAGGVDGVYVPMPVAPDYQAFAAFMDLVARHDWLDVSGLSITLPHKENALRWLRARDGEVDPLAERIGAVNTLTPTGHGRWRGDNTDASGAIAALEAGGTSLDGRRVAILGAGGVARAVAVALSQRGCDVTIFGRTRARAERLAQELRCGVADWAERGECAADILINCTPVGLWPDIDDSPMPRGVLRPEQVVLDTIYNPAETRLLRDAAARGCRVSLGTEMFVSQAAGQYLIWHCDPPARDVMAEAMSAARTV